MGHEPRNRNRNRICVRDQRCHYRSIVASLANVLLSIFLVIDYENAFASLSVPDSRRDVSNHLACFYGSWAVYRPGRGKLDIEDIDPFLCTHLIYSFAGITETGLIKSLDPYNDLYEDYGKGGYYRFNHLRTLNPKLKTLLAVGGWDEGSEKYSLMVSTAEGRRGFIDSVIDFCQQHGFNGLVMDWEYPTFRGGVPDDRQNFALLIQEMHGAMSVYGMSLSAAVSAGKEKIDNAYDVNGLVNYLDFFYVMTLDFRGSWESFTGHHSPLYGHQNDIMDNPTLNTNFSVNYWLNVGVPSQKVALVIPFYGRTFTLADVNQYWAFSPSIGPGNAGPYTRVKGSLSYQEICEFSTQKPWPAYRDPDYYGLIAAQGDQWVGYDDLYSVRSKVQYARSLQLGGIAIWALDMDDCFGQCNNEKFPLLKSINKEMGRLHTPAQIDQLQKSLSSDFIKTSNTTQLEKISDRNTSENEIPRDAISEMPPSSTNETQFTNAEIESAATDSNCQASYCSREGFRRHESSCHKFYRCVDSNDLCYFFEFECPSHLVFDYVNNVCDWQDNVPDC